MYSDSYNSELLAIANANIAREFGALNQSVSNVIYTNGALDLYLNTGMLATRNPNTVVVIIEGGEHIYSIRLYIPLSLIFIYFRLLEVGRPNFIEHRVRYANTDRS